MYQHVIASLYVYKYVVQIRIQHFVKIELTVGVCLLIALQHGALPALHPLSSLVHICGGTAVLQHLKQLATTSFEVSISLVVLFGRRSFDMVGYYLTQQ